MPSCPVCRSNDHALKTSALTGEPLLAECVKVLQARNAALEESLAEGGAHVFAALDTRVSAVESLLGQKVCFSTFDALAAKVAELERRLAASPVPPAPASEPAPS